MKALPDRYGGPEPVPAIELGESISLTRVKAFASRKATCLDQVPDDSTFQIWNTYPISPRQCHRVVDAAATGLRPVQEWIQVTRTHGFAQISLGAVHRRSIERGRVVWHTYNSAISAMASKRALMRANSARRLARRAASSAITMTASKNVSTGACSCDKRVSAPA